VREGQGLNWQAAVARVATVVIQAYKAALRAAAVPGWGGLLAVPSRDCCTLVSLDCHTNRSPFFLAVAVTLFAALILRCCPLLFSSMQPNPQRQDCEPEPGRHRDAVGAGAGGAGGSRQ
jgi:hypothetical protein